MTRARASEGKRGRRRPVAERAANGPGAGNADVAPDGPSEDAIRLRAYEIYLRRNGATGDALEDWLAAERALRTLAPGELS